MLGVIYKITKKINKFDVYILTIIKKYLKNKYLDLIMKYITKLGDMGLVWFIISLMLLISKTYRGIGLIIIFALMISVLLGEGIIKHSVRRVRPFIDKEDVTLIIGKPITYSFPSGHTMSSFAATSVLSFYFTKYSLIFLILASAIAFSRVYLYVHYPTDIVAGIILGIICGDIILYLVSYGYLGVIFPILKGYSLL